MSARGILCVALDRFEPAEAVAFSARLGPAVDMVKVGLGLYARGGRRVVDDLVASGRAVFLDLKLHDIPSQVADAVTAATESGAELLTLHTAGGVQMLRAAVEARGSGRAGPAPDAGLPTDGAFAGPRPLILGVSVLTSLGPSELRGTGIHTSLNEVLRARVRLAHEGGLDGIVCSPMDLPDLMTLDETADLLRVTPGIRLPGTAPGDQQRIATPADALRDGAHVLVVGRPITQADDPIAAAAAIRAAMESAG